VLNSGFHALFGEPLTGGLLTAERAGRADVVGRDRITEQHQRAGVVDICDTGLFQRKSLKKGGSRMYVEESSHS